MERFLIDRNGFEAELVALADEVVAAETLPRSSGALLGKLLSSAEFTETLNSLGSGSGHVSPAEIFDAFAYSGRGESPRNFEQFFEVVATPRAELFEDSLRPGDLLVRRALGEGNLAHVAMLATGEALDARDLESAGLTPESERHGLYAQVLELGAFPKNVQDRFARRLADESGWVGYDQMILRLRPEIIARGASSRASVETTLPGSFLRECAEDLERLQEDEGEHKCREGEGPPAELPDPEGKGLHPLVYRGVTPRRSRNPSVGDAQQLLNRFLKQLKEGGFQCKPGADMKRIQEIRNSLQEDPLVVDCRFGPDTEKATLMFQRCVFPDKPKEWDGKIGPKTWAELVKFRICTVTLTLKTTGKVVPAPENPRHDDMVAAAGGVDDLGPLPMGQGRADFPGQAFTSPLMVIGTVIPAETRVTFRWKRFIQRRSWNIRLNAAGTEWVVTQRSRRGFPAPEDDTGAPIFNVPTPSSTRHLYIYDNSALVPGNNALDKIGDFIYEEKDFLYKVERDVAGNTLTCAQFHVGQIIKVRRQDTKGNTAVDWAGLENSTAVRTLDVKVTQAKVRAMVGGTLPIQIDPHAND